MSELLPFQKTERSVVGRISEGIVLTLFRGSGYLAFHAGELDPTVYAYREFLIDKHCVLLWMEYDIQPPTLLVRGLLLCRLCANEEDSIY